MVEASFSEVFNEIMCQTPPRLLAAMQHSVFGAGKRFRPFLLMKSAEIFGSSSLMSLRVAVALECVHCYSLTHDDLPSMDNDVLRRGKPTVHIVFGEALAMMAGDSLLMLAFEILADERSHPDPAIRSRLILALARASGACSMTGGQALDIESLTDIPDEADIMRLQAMKTGALLRYAVIAGGIIGKADESALFLLGAYGDAVGMAFQIADDLLDANEQGIETGGSSNRDVLLKKVTLVQKLGVDEARHRLTFLVDEAIAHLADFGPEAEPLREAARFVITRET